MYTVLKGTAQHQSIVAKQVSTQRLLKTYFLFVSSSTCIIKSVDSSLLPTPTNGQVSGIWQEHQVLFIREKGERLCEGLLLTVPSSSFTPFAARTQQYVKEQFGQADEKVHDILGILRSSYVLIWLRRSFLPTTSNSRKEWTH